MNTAKTNHSSFNGLFFSFTFMITAITSMSTMTTPVMAANFNAPRTVAATDRDVWQSETGKCYHNINNCGKMNPNKAKKIKESKAKSLGLKKCKKCW